MAPLLCTVMSMPDFLLGRSSLQISAWEPRSFAFFCTASSCFWQDGRVKVSCWFGAVFDLVPVSCLPPAVQVPSLFSAAQRHCSD